MRQTPTAKPFANRLAAGRALANRLKSFAHREDVVVLALPRGGVPVGSEIARALDVPLDVFVVRKLSVPHHPELAMGAIAGGGVRVLNEKVIEWYRIDRETIEDVVLNEQRKLDRRERAYRQGRPASAITGKVVIVVDDGLATGSTLQAAIAAIRHQQPARIVMAVPVGPREACDGLAFAADEVICLRTPDPFVAVGRWYQNFPVTSDDEVREILSEHRIGSRSFATS